MINLDEMAIEFGTDKASKHPTGGHDYARHYQELFRRFRDSETTTKILEIGVGGGESIRLWLEYFGYWANAFGVDVVKNTNEWNDPDDTPHNGYTFSHGDQTDRTMWKCFLANHGRDFDIIIDDGGHCNNEIIISFEELWPHLKSGGLYCIEDLAVGYGEGSVFIKPGFPRHMDWLHSKLDELNKGGDIDAMYFFRELVVFKKK